MNSISIAVEHSPDQETKSAVQAGLFEANVQSTGDGNFDLVFVAARDSNSKIIGGVVGEAYWGWVNFTTVWVHPEHRRKGLASRMLKVAESEAARKGYTQAYLDTFSFQSPDFYLRLGYEVFGKLDNFPAGSTRVFMRKIIRDYGANQIPTNTPGTEENA
ncbi:MAG: GNAT family N-acetyltransferase [Rhodocyclaceae bacterium]|nr:GNAT family N-acetyltransferase [Rhodocyclaceae bacterium]